MRHPGEPVSASRTPQDLGRRSTGSPCLRPLGRGRDRRRARPGGLEGARGRGEAKGLFGHGEAFEDLGSVPAAAVLVGEADEVVVIGSRDGLTVERAPGMRLVRRPA